jgi:alpha-L-fucosidase
MLLNVPPNKEGLFAGPDVRRLNEFGEAIRRLFARDLARNQPIEASSRRAGPERDFAPANAVDGDPATFWAGEDGVTNAELRLSLPGAVKFNLVSVREPYWFGERARAWRLEAEDASGVWKVLARGTVIGSRNLLSLPETTATRVRLVIESALGCPAVSEFALYHSDLAPQTTSVNKNP